MKSVRAYLYKSKDFLYPDDKTYTSLATFWGIIAGMEARGERFEISYGSGLYDTNHVEIFEKDIIIVYSFVKSKGRVLGERAEVVYEAGCFNAVNQIGLDVDLGSCIHDDGMNYVVIDQNIYSLIKRP